MLSTAAATLLCMLAQDKEKVRIGLKDSDVTSAWIYDDLPAGFAQAQKTKKPILVVFR